MSSSNILLIFAHPSPTKVYLRNASYSANSKIKFIGPNKHTHTTLFGPTDKRSLLLFCATQTKNEKKKKMASTTQHTHHNKHPCSIRHGMISYHSTRIIYGTSEGRVRFFSLAIINWRLISSRVSVSHTAYHTIARIVWNIAELIFAHSSSTCSLLVQNRERGKR